jgi:hypothetical protein
LTSLDISCTTERCQTLRTRTCQRVKRQCGYSDLRSAEQICRSKLPVQESSTARTDHDFRPELQNRKKTARVEKIFARPPGADTSPPNRPRWGLTKGCVCCEHGCMTRPFSAQRCALEFRCRILISKKLAQRNCFAIRSSIRRPFTTASTDARPEPLA